MGEDNTGPGSANNTYDNRASRHNNNYTAVVSQNVMPINYA